MTAASADQQANSLTPERILQRIDWQVIRRLDGLFQGDYRTLFYGQGIDFADLREYQPLDDIRHIDWNVTARMNAPYVRQFVEDREITAWFLLDLSRSMSFGVDERRKAMVLVDFVTTLSRILTRAGNRVGALLFDSRLEKTIPARTGRNQVLRLTNELLLRHPEPSDSTTDLSPLLIAANNTIKRRSLVFLISDFITDDGWIRPINQLNRRHDFIAVRIFHPREIELPDVGVIFIEDAETGEKLYVDTSNQAFRKRYNELIGEREIKLQTAFDQSSVDLISLSTEDDMVRSLVRFAELRKRFQQRRQG